MVDPASAQDFQAEEKRLRAKGDSQGLVDLYYDRAGHLGDAARERMLFQAGEVAQDELNDPRQAEQFFQRAYNVRKSYARALGALKVLHKANKNSVGLLKVLELEREGTTDDRRRGQLSLEIADLVRKKDPKRALDNYAQAIEAWPKSRAPLDELEKLARELKRYELLVRAYEQLAGVASDKQAAIYFFLGGTVLFENLKDSAGAAAAYNAALGKGPKDPRILKAIVRHFEKQKDWDGLANALWQQLEVVETKKERLSVRKRLAWVYEACLNQPKRSRPVLLKALEESPQDEQLVASLLKVCKGLKDPKAIAEAYEFDGALGGRSPKEQAESWALAAESWDRAKKGKQAYAAAQEALKLDSKSPKGLKLLEKITHKLAKWDEHAKVLAAELTLLKPKRSDQEKAASLKILKRLAETRELKLKDPTGAREALSQIVDLAPEERWAWDRLRGLARDAGDWSGLVEASQGALKHVEDKDKVEIWRELGQVYSSELGDPKSALEPLESLIKAAPKDLAGHELLCTVLRELGDWKALAKRMVPYAKLRATPAEKAAAYRELAELRLEKLDDASGALKDLDAALKVESKGSGALASWKLKAKIAERLGDDDLLRASLARVKEFEQDPDTLRWVRIQLAKLEERAGNLEGALATLQEILSEVPDDPDALPVAVRLLRELKRLDEAVAILEAAAVVVADRPERAHQVLSDLGALLDGELGDTARAAEAWGRALRARPEEARAFDEAVRTARASGGEKALFRVLDEVANEVRRPERSEAYLRELAALARGPLKDPKEAARRYERLRAALPADPEAGTALRELLRELARWSDLTALLEDLAKDDVLGDARGCWREAARVAESELEDLPRAASALEVLLEGEGDPQEPAFAALASLYDRLEQGEEQIAVLLRQDALLLKGRGEFADDAARAAFRAERLSEAATVAETRLNDLRRAAEFLGQALKATPGALALLERLARVQEASGEPREAERTLVLAAEAASENSVARSGFHLQRGRLWEGPLADPQAAEEAYGEAISADPQASPPRQALIALLEQHGRWEPLQKALADAAEHDAGERKPEYLNRRGEVLAGHLERLDGALEAFDEAEKLKPKWARTRQARVDALRVARRPEALADALAARREAAPSELDTTQTLALFREEAELRAFTLEDKAAGRGLLLEALKVRSKDLGSLRLLLRVERQLGLGEPLIDRLEQTANLEKSAGRKAALLVEAGRVTKTRTAARDRAKALFKAALEADPERIEAVRWLETIAREAGNAPEQINWLEAEARLETGPRRQAVLFHRIGRLHGRKNPKAAREAYERALAQDPAHLATLRALAPLLRRSKAWPALDRALGELAKAESDPRLRVERLVAQGDLRLRGMRLPLEARESFDQALGIDPKDARALRGRAATFDATKEPRDLARALIGELGATPRAERRVVLAKRIAELQQDNLDDAEAAVETLGEVVRLRPQDADAWKRLRSAHVQRRDWAALCVAYEREAQVRREIRTQEELYRSAAQIAQHHLQDLGLAARLYQEVLDRGDPECLAISVLPDLLRKLDDGRALEAALERIPDVVPRAPQAGAALRELGQRAEGRNEDSAAIGLYESSLEHVPTSTEALDRLAALHEKRREWELYLRALERKRKLVIEREQLELRLRAAEVLERELFDPAGATRELLAAEAQAAAGAGQETPTPEVQKIRRRCLDWLSRLARQLERFDLLAAVMGKQAAVEEEAASAASLWIQRAELLRDRLADPRAAIQAYEEAFTRHPSPDSRSPQADLQEQEEQWEDLVQSLATLAPLISDRPQRADVFARQAGVLDQKIGRADDAIEAWEKVVELVPERREAYRALEEISERTGNRRALARTLERELEILTEEPDALVARALRAGEIYRSLQLRPQACAVLERARSVVPLEGQVFSELETLYREERQSQALYELLSDRAGLVGEAGERARLHEQCAVVAGDELGDPERARTHWEAVLSEEGAHPQATLALKAAYAEAEAWEDLARVLAREVETRRTNEAEGEPDTGLATLLLSQGEVLERRLERHDEAAEVFRAAAARAGDDPRPLQGLERIHVASQAWEEAIEVRRALRDLATAPVQRAQLSIGIADAHVALGRPADAVAALEAALEEDPEDRAILARLRLLLLEEEEWKPASSILAREADGAPERSEEVVRRLERAELVRDRLKDEAEAIAEFERVRALAPLDLRPLMALSELYRKAKETLKLVEVLEARGELEEDDEVAGSLFVEAGELHRESDPKRSAESFERAHGRDNLRHEPLEALVELYGVVEQPEDQSRVLHKRAELARSLDEPIDNWLLRSAEVEEEELSAPRRAAFTLEQLLTHEPEHPDALTELARLRGELGEHAAHAEVLARRAKLAEPGERRRELLMERAEILDTKLERPTAAAACLAEASAELPRDELGLRRQLAGDRMRLLERGGLVSDLLEATEEALACPSDAEDERALLPKVGELTAKTLYRPERAIAVYERLYGLDPEAAREPLEELYAREARHTDLVRFWRGEIERYDRLSKESSGPQAAQRAAALRYRLGELLAGTLSRPDEAEVCYRELLERDADQEPARDALEVLLRQHGRDLPLCALLDERAQRASTSGDKEAAALIRLDQAATSERLEKHDDAMSQLEEALRGASQAATRTRALRNLVRLYRAARKHEDLARVLGTFADEPQLSAHEQSALRAELGALLLRELKRPDEAASSFSKALELDAMNVPAARGLADIYRSQGRWSEAALAHEREVAAKVDRGRRVWLYGQLGTIRQKLGELPKAREAFLAALQLDPKSLIALRGLAEVARQLSDPQRLAQALEALAELSPSPIDRRESRRELAEVAAKQLNNPAKAVECYQLVLEESPGDREALVGLSEALEGGGDTAGLVGALERRLSMAKRDEERYALALRTTALREQLAKSAHDPVLRKQQLERAFELGAIALGHEPEGQQEALAAYARVAEELGRWSELAEATCRMARRLDDPQRSGWMFRKAAKLSALRLSDPRGAVAAYQEAVEIAPDDRQSWQELVPLASELRDPDLEERARRALLQLAKSAADRVKAALALGKHLFDRDKVAEAIDALVLARSEARGPQKNDAITLLRQAYERSERWAELAEVFGVMVKKGICEDPRQTSIERALILEQHLSRHDQALEVLRRLHEEEPSDQRVTHQLERLLSHTRRWTELVQLYESEANRRGRGGVDSLVLLGRLARDQLDDPKLAAQALERAVALNPTGSEALEHLKDVYQRSERWPKLLDTLRLEIGLVKDAQKREQLLRAAAELAEEKLGDLATAERFYAEIVGLAPHDKTLVQALARVQEGRGEWGGLAEALGRELGLTNDRGEIVTLRRRLAEVYATKLAQPFQAIEQFRRLLDLNPQDPEALKRLTELLREQREWTELTRVLEQRIRQDPRSIPLQLELARTHSERLEQPAPAIQAAERVLQQDSQNREAAELLVETSKRFKSAPAGLAQALQRLATVSQGHERACALHELAGILTKDLGQREGALSALREAFRADPTHEEVIEALATELDSRNFGDELIKVFEGGARAAKGQRAGELLARAAQVYLARGDGKNAIQRLRESLERAPEHVPALEGLARILAAQAPSGAGRASQAESEELCRLYIRRAKIARDPDEAALALVSAGDVLRDRLERYEGARRQYEAALQRSPQSLDALASLAELSYAAGKFKEAGGYFDRLAASPRLTSGGETPERAAELLYARGDCCLKLNQREKAVASFREALRMRPNHLQALEDLGRTLVEDGAWAAAKPVFVDLVKLTKAPKLQAAHRLTLAKIFAELNDPARGVDLFRRGLELLPKRYDGHLALARLLKEQDAQGARRHFEFVLAGDDSGAQGEARLELADLCERVFKQPDVAAGHLQAALELRGSHRAQAARRLAEVHGRAERWGDAVHNLRRGIEFEEEPTAKAELLANLARVLRDRMKKPALARQCFERSLELAPGHLKNLESLLRILAAAGDKQATARQLGAAADHARDSGQGDESALRLRRAQVLRELKEIPAAVNEYERVLKLDPDHSGARAALGELYLETGDARGAAKIHRRLLERDPLALPSYQALAKAWGEAGKSNERGQAVHVLASLRAARGRDRQTVEASSQMPKTKAQIKDEDFSKVLVHPDARGLIRDFAWHAGHLLLKQVPSDLGNHGIGWRTPRYAIEGDAFPEHDLLKRICDLLGITQLEVYHMDEWRMPEPVLCQGKSGPAIVLCPEVFEGLTEAGKAFVLGRALGTIKLNLYFFRCMQPDQAKQMVLGALKGFDNGRSFPGSEDRSLRGVVKAFSKAGELRESLDTVQKELWRNREVLDFEAIARGVAGTGSRTGLLVAGGLYPVAQTIEQTNMSLRGRVPENAAGVIKLFREVPELCDLAPFAVSKGYLKLRDACLRLVL
jgi:tetratricopeptide (TPR) repeat protein